MCVKIVAHSFFAKYGKYRKYVAYIEERSTRKGIFFLIYMYERLCRIKMECDLTWQNVSSIPLLCTWDENQTLNHTHTSHHTNHSELYRCIVTWFLDWNFFKASFLIHCLLNLNQIIFTTCDFSRAYNSFFLFLFKKKAFAYLSLFSF